MTPSEITAAHADLLLRAIWIGSNLPINGKPLDQTWDDQIKPSDEPANVMIVGDVAKLTVLREWDCPYEEGSDYLHTVEFPAAWFDLDQAALDAMKAAAEAEVA